VVPLLVGEVERLQQPSRLVGIVVHDGGLEPLPRRKGLAQLPPHPAQQADRVRPWRGHRAIVACMSKGYAEGPALEERVAELERAQRRAEPRPDMRAALFGSTDAKPDTHFLGWADEVDEDALFAGGAFGITRRKIAT
jgi:hypothetical protein